MAGQTMPGAEPPPPAGLNGPTLAALEPWWPREAGDALRVALAAIAAVWLAMWLELELPHWAGWTVISVTLSTRAASLRKSLWRAGATVVGVVISITLVANFAQATLAFDVALALWLGLLTTASTIESGQRSYGFALMGFTVPIIALAHVQIPQTVFQTGVDRCSTILLGIGCAYVANALVAPGVPAVSRTLADKLEAAARACAAWVADARRGADPGPMPLDPVIGLREGVADAFTEQPSLRSGGRPVRDAPQRLRHALAAGLLRALLPDRTGARSTMLLGDGRAHADRQAGRVRVAARMLREGRRLGRRRAPFRPHLLLWNDLDWDGRHAVSNGLRTIAAVSLVNAFWYASGWTYGSDAATWAGLLCALLAAHPDPAGEARAFIVGAVLAAVVGLTARYTLLTGTGDFLLLAAVLLPVCMLAVVGRSDKRAVYGVGFGFFILGVIDPTNVMTYDLGASLNTVLAELLGMGAAVVAFSALPPPVDAATRRMRACRRLVTGVRRAALWPHPLLPPRERWLSRAFGRLALLGAGQAEEKSAADAATIHAGQTLLVVGLLLVALRETDERLGREVGRLAWAAMSAEGPEGAGAPREALDRLAARENMPELQAERITTVAALLAAADLSGWPGLRREGRA